MKVPKSVVATAFVLLSLASLNVAQSNMEANRWSKDNPFPDVIARSRVVMPFDDNAPKKTLSGVVIQEPLHINQRYQYFRMAAVDPSSPTGVAIWAVLMGGVPDTEAVRLKSGVYVTLLGTPVKDGTRRVELVQPAPPTTASLANLNIAQ